MIRLERSGEVAVITLDRPEVMNALSFELLRRFGEALDEVSTGGYRALVVTGAGDRAFCADLGELRDRPPVECMRGQELGLRVFQRIEELPLVSIAGINGYALGGGLELAMACTLRVATRGAKMGCPEIKLALIPGYGGTQRLPRLVGLAKAQELILTGAMIRTDEAERLGLVNRVVEGDALEAALALAAEMTRFSLHALDLARRALLRAGETPLGAGLASEAELVALAYSLEDSREGIGVFLEKRQPRFRDR